MSSCEGRGVRCLVCGIGWAHAVRPSVVWMGGWDEQLGTQFTVTEKDGLGWQIRGGAQQESQQGVRRLGARKRAGVSKGRNSIALRPV